MKASINTLLHDFLDANTLKPSEQQFNKLQRFLSLVQEWNEKINITGHKDIHDLILKDIVDNLYLNLIIENHKLTWNSLIDLGCGAGFSGIVLSVMQPNKQITFLDSHRKKMNFVKYACRELGLLNCKFIQDRVEEGSRGNENSYDLVISRATWGLNEFINWSKNYVQNNGHALYLCGPSQLLNIDLNSNHPFFSLSSEEFYTIKPNEYKRHVIILNKSSQMFHVKHR